MRITTEGFAELEQAFAEIGRESTRRAAGARAILKALEPIRERAAQLAPVDDGELRASIAVARRAQGSRGSRGRQAVGFAGIDTAAVNRTAGKERPMALVSRVNEFGSKVLPARPYLRPAFEQRKEAAVELLKDAVAEEIDATVRRAARKTARRVAGGG